MLSNVVAYVLILSFSTGNGVSMTSIPGFTNKAQCESQAANYMKAFKSAFTTAKAVCIEVK